MKTKHTINGLTFSISTVYEGKKCWETGSVLGIKNYNNHEITVKNIETQKSIVFDFWGSIMNPEIRTKKEVLYAFRCFISDALCFQDFTDLHDFAREFGYDLNERKSFDAAQKAYKGCEKALSQCEHIGIDSSNIYDILNSLPD